MRALLIFIPALLMAQAPPPSARAADSQSAAALTTDDEKTVYSIGLSVYASLTQLDLSPGEIEIVRRALADAAAGKPAIDLSAWGPKIDPFTRARASRVAEREKAASKGFLEKAASEPGAVRAASGLIYRELTPGSGDSPKATDTVKVHYRGTLVSGKEFDSSYRRNQPAEFPLNKVIPCWTEGVQKMKTGGKAVLVCPSNLAYGDSGRPSIPGGATLVFEIELLGITGAAPLKQ